MKNVALITINDLNNYGNRLQNYATQSILKKYGCKVENIIDTTYYNSVSLNVKKRIKYILKKTIGNKIAKRYSNFLKFNKKINYSKYSYNQKIFNIFDYFIVGSDQVWNPNFAISDVTLLNGIESSKKISFSASFGVDQLPDKLIKKYKQSIRSFKLLSVRETNGKKIIEELTGRKDIEVLIDPTMLITTEEWDKVSIRPKQLDNINEKKFILNYFLGELSESRKKEIEKVAKENDCYIINLLEKKESFYTCGPSEFLYLEKHAFLICTDSFHSSVFAILYNRPFIVFDREDKEEKMNSRIDTLLSKFELKDRKYNGKNITKENINHDYSKAYKILENERKKSEAFLRKALGIDK